SWWSEITQARARIDALSAILGGFPSLEPLRASETPARDLLGDSAVADVVISKLSSPGAGKGDDELCQWMYETYHSGDPELQSVVVRFVPAICNAYLPRAASKPGQSLSGFEAVLLALYSSEHKIRQGKGILVTIPNLSQPSLYHTPRVPSSSATEIKAGYYSPSLQPQEAVKTTKRAAIVGVALDLFHRKIAAMPDRSKLELCCAIREWAMRGCSWAERVDEVAKLALLQAIAPGPDVTLTGHVTTVGPSSSTSIFVSRQSFDDDEDEDGDHKERTLRIPLPWELFQPILKILGHCLLGPSSSPETRDSAGAAARALYARATHEIIPEAILPTRGLLRLDEAARAASLAAATAVASA
ncbi:hypothetical protein SELMODRAFT_33879, partial [Selaginella moellendorffii]